MMRAFAFAALASAAAAISSNAISDDKLQFIKYAAQFNKVYGNVEEFNARFERFMHHHRLISEHNATEANFTLGHNQFDDWTGAEYLAILGFIPSGSDNDKSNYINCMESFNEAEIPDYVNWVEAGAVTPVKNQDRCGACWAFSSTGALEGANFVKSGELLSFSEQQLIDCTTGDYRNKGCHGGSMWFAFNYFKG